MLLLDLFIATLVLFPLLAEVLWFFVPVPGSMALLDLGPPLLVVALVTLAVVHRRRLVQASRAALERSPGWTLGAAAAVVGVPWVLALLWARLAPSGVDLGLAVWRLTQGTGVVLGVAIVAAAVRRWSSEPWERSFFIRQGTRLAQAWLRALERAPRLTLWSAVAAVGAIFLWISLLRFRAFESHGYDLGIFTNVLWNLAHGHGYVSSVKGGINLFTDHQSPLLWALAPVFRLSPRPETLLVVQAFGLAAGGPALYYLARAHFGPGHWAAAALPWLYWPYLPLRNANTFDFHPEVFMLPLFLWAFAAFTSQRRSAKALGLLALLAALGAKESAGVVAFGIGVAWALTGRIGAWHARWPGVALAAGGVALFLINVKLVPPMFGAGEYAYLGLYERFGGGIGDVLLAPFTQPAYFLSQLVSLERVKFLFWTLAPLGFLPLFHWRAAVAALPPYLMLFLSEGDQRVRIVFHYGIEPGSALFWALPFGLAAFARRFGWRSAGIWMLVWGLAGLGPSELSRAIAYAQSRHTEWLNAHAIPCMNPHAPMAASDVLIPHLSTRFWISYPELLRQQPSGELVRCVVTDLRVSNWPLGRGGVQRVLDGLPEQGYREVFRCREFSVYELGDSGCLRCVPRCY